MPPGNQHLISAPPPLECSEGATRPSGEEHNFTPRFFFSAAPFVVSLDLLGEADAARSQDELSAADDGLLPCTRKKKWLRVRGRHAESAGGNFEASWQREV